MEKLNFYPHFPFKIDPDITFEAMVKGTCPIVCEGSGSWHEQLCVARAKRAWEILKEV